jgi:predicted component of type VI protein secretion system
MRASLTVLSGPLAGQTIEIPHGKLLIGREVDCHVRPDSALISRHHCVLLLDDYTLRIRDLGSKNGTFVNNHRIPSGETILIDGDTVTVGEMSCHIDLAEEVVEAPPVALPHAMEGTAIFEGDTVQPANPELAVPPVTVPPVTVPPTPNATI